MAERAVVYLRVSSQDQELAIQVAECTDYWRQRGYDVVEVVQEKETGVDSYDWRPGLRRVRDILYGGHIDVLLMWKVDRANRDSTDNLRLLRLSADTGVRLESVHDGVITNDMTGRMKMFMLGESGRAERDSIMLRTRAGLRQRVADGMPLVGSYPLYGYRYTYGPGKRIGTVRKTGYELEPQTAVVVQRCFESVAAGYSLHRLARELNTEGIPTPSAWLASQGMLKPGKQPTEQWSRQMLYQLLRNPSYCGHHVAYKRRYIQEHQQDGSKPRRKMLPRPENDPSVVVIPIPAIVEEQLWQDVQTIMAAHKAEATRRSTDPESTLLRAGFAICGHCGARMTAAKHHSGYYRVYVCRNRKTARDWVGPSCSGGAFALRASEVDEDTWKKVCEIAQDSEKVKQLLASRKSAFKQELEHAERENASLTAQIEECRTEITTITQRLGTASDVVYQALTERLQVVTASLIALEHKEKPYAVRVGKYALLIVNTEKAARLLADSHKTGMDALSYAERREILRLLGVQVKMYATNSEYFRREGQRWEFTFGADEEHSDMMRERTMTQRDVFTWKDWLEVDTKRPLALRPGAYRGPATWRVAASS